MRNLPSKSIPISVARAANPFEYIELPSRIIVDLDALVADPDVTGHADPRLIYFPGSLPGFHQAVALLPSPGRIAESQAAQANASGHRRWGEFGPLGP